MFDRQSTYLTWGGSIGSPGTDVWQCGVHLALSPSTDGPGLPSNADLQTLYDGPLTAFHQAATNWISASTQLNWAKAASLDPSGHYTHDPVSYGGATVHGGSTAPNRGGPQVSMCVTLFSGSHIGMANYGRFYIPWWEAQVQDDGRVTDGVMESVATNAKTLVDAINSWAVGSLSATARVAIMSRKGAGLTKRAAHVWVGNVKDTQQRRRRQIAELYYARDVA